MRDLEVVDSCTDIRNGASLSGQAERYGIDLDSCAMKHDMAGVEFGEFANQANRSDHENAVADSCNSFVCEPEKNDRPIYLSLQTGRSAHAGETLIMAVWISIEVVSILLLIWFMTV